MTSIQAINPTETEHLAEVISKMKTLGTPTIRCIYRHGMYYAIEGSHRLAACDYLGIAPTIDNVVYIYGDDGVWVNGEKRSEDVLDTPIEDLFDGIDIQDRLSVNDIINASHGKLYFFEEVVIL